MEQNGTVDVQGFQFSNATYNKLKSLVTVILPAFSSAYYGLAELWDFPNVAGVVGSIAIITTLLGTLLGISTRSYKANYPYDGDLVVSKSESGGKVYALELHGGDVDNLDKRDTITFKVRS